MLSHEILAFTFLLDCIITFDEQELYHSIGPSNPPESQGMEMLLLDSHVKSHQQILLQGYLGPPGPAEVHGQWER